MNSGNFHDTSNANSAASAEAENDQENVAVNGSASAGTASSACIVDTDNDEERTIKALQEQIIALENKLENVQLRYIESEFQQEALKVALQYASAARNTVTASAAPAVTMDMHSSSAVIYTNTSAVGLDPTSTGIAPDAYLTQTPVGMSYMPPAISPNAIRHPFTALQPTAGPVIVSPAPITAITHSSFAAASPNTSCQYATFGHQNNKSTAATTSTVYNGGANHNAAVSMSAVLTQSPCYSTNVSTGQGINGPQSSMGIPEVPPANVAVTPLVYSSVHNPLGAVSPSHANPYGHQIGGLMVLRKLQDLPEFSGHAEDWPVFFTAFQQTTAAYGYSNLENNQRLQKSLKGEARESVKSLLIHPDNVVAIIEQLRFQFGRPEQLIRSQLYQIREIPISENSIVKLVPFATKVKNLVAFLQSANGQLHLANPTLIEELVGKLQMIKKIEWAKYSLAIQPYATVVHFSEWLTQTANLIRTVQDYEKYGPSKCRPVLHVSGKQNESFNEQQQAHIPDESQSLQLKCAVCYNAHKTAESQRLRESTTADRWREVKRCRLCFSCLSQGHTTRECRRRKPCHIDGCQRMHHRMLHDNDQNQTQPKNPSTVQSGEQAVTQNKPILSCSDTKGERKLLFRILPVTLHGQRKSIDTFALLDEGSAVTLIDNDLCKELGWQGEKHNLNVQWFGGKMAQEPSVVVDLFVRGIGKKKKHKLSNVYSVLNLNLPAQTLKEADLLYSASGTRKLPLEPYNGAVPKLLIGLDHCQLGLPSEIIKKNCTGPYAANTELGWTVFGPSTEIAARAQICLLTTPIPDQTKHDMIAEYFEIENFGVKAAPVIDSAADLCARTILDATTRRVNGRFETGLLWKQNFIKMPDSYDLAEKRLISIEKNAA